MMARTASAIVGFLLCLPCPNRAQTNQPAWTAQEKPIYEQIRGLRNLPDDFRAAVTKQLAEQIRALPATPEKLTLAVALAGRSTEGDFGHDTVQAAADTLAGALRDSGPPAVKGQPAEAYLELAEMAHFEHVDVSLDDPQYREAVAKVEADDTARTHADFTLRDLGGRAWTLGQLRGKVVLVNFWATWCPPCRKEMPDLQALYDHFKDQGLVILGISDEDNATVKSYLAEHPVSYPVLLDAGRRVNKEFEIDGIPKTFVYNREGKLVAESLDMRTRNQFLQMLSQAGLR